jgi:hypothetical protein
MSNEKLHWFDDRAYRPIVTPGSPANGDSDELAAQGDRLMFRHGSAADQSALFIAPKGERTAGYVIGVFID